jgi:hypothetical protein
MHWRGTELRKPAWGAPEKREDEEQKEGASLDHLKPPATPCTEESIPHVLMLNNHPTWDHPGQAIQLICGQEPGAMLCVVHDNNPR